VIRDRLAFLYLWLTVSAFHPKEIPRHFTANAGGFNLSGEGSLLLLDVDRLKAFGAFFDVELDRIALIQGAVSGRIDCGVMAEDILAAFALNESVAFFTVEPLYRTSFHRSPLFNNFSYKSAFADTLVPVQPIVSSFKNIKTAPDAQRSERDFCRGFV
jgi:hypothetical protein